MLLPHLFRGVSRRSKRFVVATILAVALVSSVPHIIGMVQRDQGESYLGLNPINSADMAVYLSFMRQASHGSVFVENMHTSEAQGGSILHPLWMTLGWIGGLSHMSLSLIFHVARIVLSAALLLFIYAFLCRVFTSARTRNIAFLLIAFSSGVGWTVGGITLTDSVAIQLLLPTDRWVSESNTFLTIFHSPLFPLSQLLMLAMFWYWMDERRYRSFLFPAALFGLLAVIHPYDTITVLAVCGVATFVRFAHDSAHSSKDLVRQIRRLLLLLLFAAPPLVQFWVAARIEPAIGGWVAQNITLSPPLTSYLLGYGALVPLAILGWVVLRHTQSQRVLFVLSWFTTNAALLYLPLQVNRRFSNGFHIVLSLMAAVGIAVIVSWWERRPRTLMNELIGHAAVWSAAIVLFFSNLVFVVSAVYWLQTPIGKRLSYIPYDVRDAFVWLDRETPQDAIALIPDWYGNLLPAMTHLHSYLGHGHQTILLESKVAMVRRFMFSLDTVAERGRFLRSQNITYLVLMHDEYTRFFPEREPYLRRVFVEGATEVYAVVPNE